MITVRPARLPQDKPAIIDFIWGLQRYEAAFEHDRRLDGDYAEEQFAAITARADKGSIFLAEVDGHIMGWVVVIEDESPVYVIDEERHAAVVVELYVDPQGRGQGAGRALLVACEEWGRQRGCSIIRIGHLASNRLAGAVYDKAGYEPYVVSRRKKL